MAKFTLHDTHKIAGHYMSYLINNDASGLNSEELAEVNGYMKSLPPNPFLEVADLEESPSFTRCKVSGLLADCYTVDIYTRDKD